LDLGSLVLEGTVIAAVFPGAVIGRGWLAAFALVTHAILLLDRNAVATTLHYACQPVCGAAAPFGEEKADGCASQTTHPQEEHGPPLAMADPPVGNLHHRAVCAE
jgi:hypothetical protein